MDQGVLLAVQQVRQTSEIKEGAMSGIATAAFVL